MYGDTTTIRALAAQLRERGDEIRGEAARLATRAGQVSWQGLAADAMREQARVRAAALRRTAALHDDAADALDRHAREVDRLKDLIAAIERKVHDLLDEAADGVGGIVSSLRDLLPGGLSGFVPPPPGSRAWLGVDLPGLTRS
jgi:hypothetical protein